MLFRKEESEAKPRKFKRKRDGCRFDTGDGRTLTTDHNNLQLTFEQKIVDNDLWSTL